MRLKISLQFANDFKTVKDVSLSKKVKNVLEVLKSAKNISDIPQFRKVNGGNNVYKTGIGFYYILGTMVSDDEMILLRFLHRNQIIEATSSN